MSNVINKNGTFHLSDKTDGLVGKVKKITDNQVVDEHGTKYIRFPDDSLMVETKPVTPKDQRADLSDAKVGTPCTIIIGSDRYPATVTEVHSAKEIRVQWDTSKAVPNGDTMTSKIIRDESGTYSVFTLRKNGRIVEKGTPLNGHPSLVIGKAVHHLDPHF